MDKEDPNERQSIQDESLHDRSAGSVGMDEIRRQVDIVGDEYLESLRQGKPQNSLELLKLHAELRPQLESRLKVIEAVFQATQGSSRRASTHDSNDVHPDPRQSDPRQSDFLPTVDSSGDDLIIRLGNGPTSRDSREFVLHPGEAFRIRCPHCGNQVQRVDSNDREVTCSACGSAVCLEGEATRTDEAVSMPKRLGRFELRRVLGQGAFGTVYLADDPKLSRQVALKVPRRGYFASRKEEHRFFREARSAARLRHPNIVQVHEISDNLDSPYIVCEFIDGLTLADIASGTVLSFRESVSLMVQIAEAVHFAHQNNIVHRDLKPGNILVDKNRNAFVADFGLARRDDLEITMTMDGVILGTPAYMSPEQASGVSGPIDARSDVYSLGVILYRLLCRELPFHGTKRMLMHQVIHEEPQGPRRLNENIPKDLETITLKAMAKAPGARFQSAAEMAEELKRWLRGEPIKSRPIGTAARLWRWSRRHPTIASLASVIGLLLIVGSFAAIASASYQKSLRVRADGNAATALSNKRESDFRLFRLTRQNGLDSLQRNDLTRSAYWFSNALQADDNSLSRIRLGMIQDRIPTLVNVWNLDSKLTTLRFSRNGTRLAVGTLDGIVRVLDRASGEILLEKQSSGLVDYELKILPAGDKLIFKLNKNEVQIWDVDSKALIQTLLHTEMVKSIDVNAENEIVTGCDDSTVRIWDAADGTKKAEVVFAGKQIGQARFVPGTPRVVIETRDPVGTATQMQVWDYQSKELVGSVLDHQRPNIPFDVSADGKQLVTASWDRSIRVIDIQTGDTVGKTVTLPNKGAGVYFTANENEFFTVDVNGDVSTWDAKEGARTNSNFRSDGIPGMVAVNPDRQLLAVPGRDGSIQIIWRLTGIEACTTLRNGSRITTAEFSPGGREIAIGSREGVLQVWDLAGASPTARVLQHEASVRDALFANGGKRCVSIDTDGKAYIWDVETGRRIGGPLEHEAAINECAVSRNGQLLATASSDKTVKIWDVLTGSQVGSSLPHESEVVIVSFRPDGQRLVTGCVDGTVSCWDVKANNEVRPTPVFTIKHDTKIRQVVFNEAGDLVASASLDGSVRCLDAETGLRKFGPFQHDKQANDCDFLPDGKRLATCGSDGFVNVWILSTAEIEQRLPCNVDVQSVIALKDGRILSNDNPGVSRVWHEQDGKYVLETIAQNAAVGACTYSQVSPQTNLLAVCGGWLGLDQQYGYRGAAFLWDLEDDSLFCPPLFHFGQVRRVHFDPAGTHVLTASSDQTARLWSLQRNDLTVADAKRLAALYAQMSDVQDGKVSLMPAEKQASEFVELSKKYPERFSCSVDEIENWNGYLRRLNEVQVE